LVPDTGVTEEVDGELASHTKSEEAEIVEGGFADTLVVILFLLILIELASESFEVAVFISSMQSEHSELVDCSVWLCSIRRLSQGFVAIHPSK
jgi:hypothetical protein